MEIDKLKAAEPAVTSGNSLFAEVDDRRRIMERQLKQYKAKNESLQDNFNLVSVLFSVFNCITNLYFIGAIIPYYLK